LQILLFSQFLIFLLDSLFYHYILFLPEKQGHFAFFGAKA